MEITQTKTTTPESTKTAMLTSDYKANLYKVATVFLIILCLTLVVKLVSGFGNSRGHGMYGETDSVISLTGHGEVQAVPDIANIYFTISKDAKTVKEAQDMVSEIEGKALEVLKTNEVAEKDIRTQNASFNPKYEVKYIPCNQFGCPGNNNVVVGYTASESILVKVRNVDSVAGIMQGLGTVGVTDLSGPNFSVDDEDILKAQARKEAIEDAKTKAEALAEDLGVKLGDIINFSENGDFYPMPMYAKGGVMMDSAAAAPERAALPQGENTISSDVTITFEIK